MVPFLLYAVAVVSGGFLFYRLRQLDWSFLICLLFSIVCMETVGLVLFWLRSLIS